MDFWDLEYSDAGDSGWTMYLDHSSSVSLHHFEDHNAETKEREEDSSMMSDASSGPPHYCGVAVPKDILQQNRQYWCKNKNRNKDMNKKKVHEEQEFSERFSSSLDDTASSLPVEEEVSTHKQNQDQYQRFDDFSQSYSKRRIFKGKFNSSFLQQAFPIDEKLALDNQGGSYQRKRRG